MKLPTSLSEVQSNLKSGETTLVELVEQYIQRTEQMRHLNAVLETFSEEARERAREIDQKIANRSAGKLAGMVLGIKDNICFDGHRVGAASKILEGFESVYNATVVERLLAEDAIILHRLNCDEFAMGSSNENSAYGSVLNPIDQKKVPGGSSGGSAAAVKAGLCLASLGSDTGGSIRQPASFCGVVGLKPTYGRVSRYGLLAYASSFDQIGPLTKNVEDAAQILEVIAGKDAFDSTLSTQPVETYGTLSDPGEKKKIGYVKECLEHKAIDAEVRDFMNETIAKLTAEGHQVSPVSFPHLKYMVPTYYVITTAEASSNLSRYDGIHYGYRSPAAVDIESTYKKSRSEGFGAEVKRRIMLGTFVLSAGYYDAYFSKAQKVRKLIQESTLKALEENDFLLLPTTPTTAFGLGENVDDPITMYLQDIFTVQANLAGVPAISIPLSKHSNGLPFGTQLLGRAFQEKELLTFSQHLMNNYS